MTYKNKRHLPWLLFDTLPSIIFFITLTSFGNDLVYVLVFFLFLCCSWNVGWLGDCCLFVCCFISSSYDSTRPLSDAQRVFVEWMSRWTDKHIKGTLFSQSHHPQAPWGFLTDASSCSAESSHSLPCLWTSSLHPYLLSPPLCIYTWTLSDNSKLLEDRRSPSFPPEGSAQGLSDNSSHWSSLYSCSNAFHMILAYLGQVQTQTPALNSKPHAYSVFLIHA